MNIILVLLAAGDSRRFQGNKLLHLFQGKQMYRYIIDELAGLSDTIFEKKLVITQYQTIREVLEKEGYQVIKNQNSSLGISHSIHLALEAVKESDAALCFMVCDQPYLKGATVEEFITGWKNSGKGLGCLSHMGGLGNPAVFSLPYRQELLELTGDVGGRRILRKHLNDLYLHEVSDGKEMVDIDVKA